MPEKGSPIIARWCSSFPAVMPVATEQDCYCPTCLAKAISKSIDEQIRVKGMKYMIGIASQYQKHESLMELIDYTLEEGNYVFSKWYHLKRGSCCNNDCRNCPFREIVRV